MGVVIALAVLLAANGAWQETAEARLDELLRAFEGRGEEADLEDLAEELSALGEAVLEPAARRLADDLRDGMASLAAPALVDVLSARAADLAPLRSAFADPLTAPAGRVQIARALADLDDAVSWRPELRALLADPRAALDDRLAAAGLLLESGDPGARSPLRALMESAALRPRDERQRIYAFLSRANTPDTRELLESALAAEELRPADEPRARVVDDRPPRAGGAIRAADPRKSVAAAARWTTMIQVAAVAAALVLLLACWIVQRKG